MRLALGALALLAACAAPGGPGADSEAPFCATHLPPNVVVIFAYDLGWGDLSCYG